jgi:hypothetical protein
MESSIAGKERRIYEYAAKDFVICLRMPSP